MQTRVVGVACASSRGLVLLVHCREQLLRPACGACLKQHDSQAVAIHCWQAHLPLILAAAVATDLAPAARRAGSAPLAGMPMAVCSRSTCLGGWYVVFWLQREQLWFHGVDRGAAMRLLAGRCRSRAGQGALSVRRALCSGKNGLLCTEVVDTGSQLRYLVPEAQASCTGTIPGQAGLLGRARQTVLSIRSTLQQSRHGETLQCRGRCPPVRISHTLWQAQL